ncbi:glycerophosphodiester phosphodiesterase [Flavobacterium sp.]|uniref:glycerophosphodiester phosphodiesterase n=1 Tax=Flavobacterium sp. TaxID=239 RepID=UPI003C397A2E
MLKIGHRGARGYEPENTLISFQKAMDLGVDGIELDVHLSFDGEIIVIHDETVDRTTNGKGAVNDLAVTELKKFHTDKNQQIPSLIEVLDLVNKKVFVNIELKGKGTAKPVVELIGKYIEKQQWSYKDFIISSFDWSLLEEVAILNPQIAIAVLTESTVQAALAFAKKIKATAINPDYTLLTPENSKQLKADGFQIFPWTVNEIEDITTMKYYGVDGIISDYPDRIS